MCCRLSRPLSTVAGIQFEQVLVNIIKNAYEAIGENGRIKISTHHSPLSIIIEDNGPGISEEAKQKLFTPFFTTKSSGQGIGLMFVREVLTNADSACQQKRVIRGLKYSFPLPMAHIHKTMTVLLICTLINNLPVPRLLLLHKE